MVYFKRLFSSTNHESVILARIIVSSQPVENTNPCAGNRYT
jgi:hypothetical protein